ncbi:MAG: hypothetical protein AAF725_00375 [Acidobacteriota bacterium]
MEGLFTFWTNKTGSVTRVLVAGAEGRNLLLTEVIDAGRGTSTSWLRDDASGWSARFEIRYPAGASSLREFFRAAHAAKTVNARLSWDGGASSELEQTPQHTSKLLAQNFVQGLAERGELRTVSAAIPEELVPALFFLKDHLSPESSLDADDPNASAAYAVRAVIEVLTQTAARQSEEEDDRVRLETPWVLKVGAMHNGHLLKVPAFVELAGRFQSIEGVSPLSDLDLVP